MTVLCVAHDIRCEWTTPKDCCIRAGPGRAFQLPQFGRVFNRHEMQRTAIACSATVTHATTRWPDADDYFCIIGDHLLFVGVHRFRQAAMQQCFVRRAMRRQRKLGSRLPNAGRSARPGHVFSVDVEILVKIPSHREQADAAGSIKPGQYYS